MFTYLGFCGVHSLPFFSSLLCFHNVLVEDTRLISDKTKINNYLFPRGHVFSLCIRLTRLTISRSAGSFKGWAFSFLSAFSARHDFGIWVSSTSQIMFLIFQRTKGNCLCVLIPRRINSNFLCVFTP